MTKMGAGSFIYLGLYVAGALCTPYRLITRENWAVEGFRNVIFRQVERLSFTARMDMAKRATRWPEWSVQSCSTRFYLAALQTP